MGGGIFTEGTTSDPVIAEIINSTITANSGASGGGIYISSSDSAIVANTIVAQNTVTTADPDIHGVLATGSIYNLVGDGTGQTGLTDGVNGNQVGTTATPIDPEFVDSTNEDWHLSSISPAINAGDNYTAETTYGLTTDLDGTARVVDQVVDIGAYEYGVLTPVIRWGGGFTRSYYIFVDCSPSDYKNDAKVHIEYSTTGQEGTWEQGTSTDLPLFNEETGEIFKYKWYVNEPRCYRVKIVYKDGTVLLDESDFSDILEPRNSSTAYHNSSPSVYYWDALALSSEVQSNSIQPVVTLKWSDLYNRNDCSYQINVRPKGSSTWTTLATNLTRANLINEDSTNDYDGLCWTDPTSNIETGVVYEYQVQWWNENHSVEGEEYIEVGVEADINAATSTYGFEDRGSILLVVDNRFTGELSGELAQLKADLIGDGWNVISKNVDIDDPNPLTGYDPHVEVKDLIQREYYIVDPQTQAITSNVDTTKNLQAVYFIGHIPVVKSGWSSPDSHDPRTMPADVYYGDMDGNWTSSSLPGTDQMFSQVMIPTATLDGNNDAELQVGRVDMYDMAGDFTIASTSSAANEGDLEAFVESEAELLRRYLDKTHTYRSNQWDVQQKARLTGDALWRSKTPFFPTNAFSCSWFREH